MWDDLSDERAGLSLIIASGPRQSSHSRVRVPWDSRPHFTVSDLRFPFLSPPTTRRATVRVFDPASTREWLEFKVKATLRLTVSQSVSLGVKPDPGPMTRYLLLFVICHNVKDIYVLHGKRVNKCIYASIHDCTLPSTCLAYRIGNTQSNSSSLRCHENVFTIVT
jgi:hypothetical protein